MRTGVYQNVNRNTAVVVQHKGARVAYLTMVSGAVELESCSAEKFAHDWPLYLEGYPITRAIRHYSRTGLRVSDAAADALRIVAARLAGG
jgi:hypothetical protein